MFKESLFYKILIAGTIVVAILYLLSPYEILDEKEIGLVGYLDEVAIVLVAFWVLFWIAEVDYLYLYLYLYLILSS